MRVCHGLMTHPLCCFTLVPFIKKLGTFYEMYHAYHGIFLFEVVSFCQMYHAKVVSFRRMYHAEVVSFRQMYHAEVVSFAFSPLRS